MEGETGRQKERRPAPSPSLAVASASCPSPAQIRCLSHHPSSPATAVFLFGFSFLFSFSFFLFFVVRQAKLKAVVKSSPVRIVQSYFADECHFAPQTGIVKGDEGFSTNAAEARRRREQRASHGAVRVLKSTKSRLLAAADGCVVY